MFILVQKESITSYHILLPYTSYHIHILFVSLTTVNYISIDVCFDIRNRFLFYSLCLAQVTSQNIYLLLNLAPERMVIMQHFRSALSTCKFHCDCRSKPFPSSQQLICCSDRQGSPPIFLTFSEAPILPLRWGKLGDLTRMKTVFTSAHYTVQCIQFTKILSKIKN